ncbi:MAG: hypothetical protein Q9157_008532, partial [Trypethelium eluteriae]
TDGPWSAMQFEEKTASVAEDGAKLITSPERRRTGRAVLAYGLQSLVVLSEVDVAPF